MHTYVLVLAPGKTDYTTCHGTKTTTSKLHLLPITTHTHDRRNSIEKRNNEKKRRERKERKRRKRKKKTKKERKEKKKDKKIEKRQDEKRKQGKKNEKNVILLIADPRD